MSPFPSRRRRSKRSRVMDADGLLEMFHCPYEGCSQVYVALSSFQVRPPPEWLGRACFCVQLPVWWGVGSVACGGPQQAPQACLPHAHSPQLISAASHRPCLSHRAPGVTSPPSLPTLQRIHPQPLSAHPKWLPGPSLVAPHILLLFRLPKLLPLPRLPSQLRTPLNPPGSPPQSPRTGGACEPQVTAPPGCTCSLPSGPGWDAPRAETGSYPHSRHRRWHQ